MQYTVKHYHAPTMGPNFNPFSADDDPNNMSIYNITAGSPFEAAVIAHGLHSGYTFAQITDDTPHVTLSLRERLEDEFNHHSMISALRHPAHLPHGDIYYYDDISRHFVVVEEATENA
jgi:hypothetical protein